MKENRKENEQHILTIYKKCRFHSFLGRYFFFFYLNLVFVKSSRPLCPLTMFFRFNFCFSFLHSFLLFSSFLLFLPCFLNPCLTIQLPSSHFLNVSFVFRCLFPLPLSFSLFSFVCLSSSFSLSPFPPPTFFCLPLLSFVFFPFPQFSLFLFISSTLFFSGSNLFSFFFFSCLLFSCVSLLLALLRRYFSFLFIICFDFLLVFSYTITTILFLSLPLSFVIFCSPFLHSFLYLLSLLFLTFVFCSPSTFI